MNYNYKFEHPSKNIYADKDGGFYEVAIICQGSLKTFVITSWSKKNKENVRLHELFSNLAEAERALEERAKQNKWYAFEKNFNGDLKEIVL